jgi:hypothetical protein
MSLLYYSRMRFTIQLLPLLLSSTLPAHVISIFGPGRDNTQLLAKDLSLRSPKNYGFIISGSHIAYLTTFFMEHLAAQHPGKLALVHYFPGLVMTHAFDDPSLPMWFRWTFKYGGWLIKRLPTSVSREDSGERTLFLATERFPAKGEQKTQGILAVSSDGVVGGGAYRANWDGEPVPTGNQYMKLREEGWLDKSVGHTLKAFSEIEAGRPFTE